MVLVLIKKDVGMTGDGFVRDSLGAKRKDFPDIVEQLLLNIRAASMIDYGNQIVCHD